MFHLDRVSNGTHTLKFAFGYRILHEIYKEEKHLKVLHWLTTCISFSKRFYYLFC